MRIQSQNTSRWLRFSAFAITTLLLASCANHHFRVASPAEGPPSDMPPYVELLASAQVATLHFPAGSYSYYAADDVGYYYRAPQKIAQHTGGLPVMRDGGVYVSKRNTKHIRGYVYLAGGVTHVGDLSRVKHQFHD